MTALGLLRSQWACLIVVLALSPLCGCGTPTAGPKAAPGENRPQRGDLSNRGGTATVREAYEERPDDPRTTNDETNDQPTGHLGTVTMIVSQEESGNTYTLDVELDGLEVDRIYFPRGDWVDLDGCELEDDLTGECVDENGKHWTFEGKS